MKRIFSIVFALALVLGFSLVMVVPAGAVATTYYVAKTGLDTNDGSSAHPWLTIQHAVDTVPAESTINVAAGTYTENVAVNKAVSIIGNSAAYTTWAPGDTRTVNANSAGHGFNIIASGVTINGFEIKNAKKTPITGAGYYGVRIAANTATVQNLNIHDSDNGVLIYGITGAQVLNSAIHDLTFYNPDVGGYGNDYALGVHVAGTTASNYVVSGNNIYNFSRLGFIDEATTSTGGSIANNQFHDYQLASEPAIDLWYASATTVDGNSIVGNFLIGVYVHGAAPGDGRSHNITIQNNTITLSQTTSWYGILIYGQSHDDQVKTNTISSVNYRGILLLGSSPGPHDELVQGNTIFNLSADNGQGIRSEGANNQILNNIVHDMGVVGIQVRNQYATNNTVQGNTVYNVTNATYGIGIWVGNAGDASGVVVSGNVLRNNRIGIQVGSGGAGGSTGGTFSYNTIYDNTAYGLVNAGATGMVNATNNWWGDNSGPGPVGPGTGDKVSANVNYSSWTCKIPPLIGGGTASFTPGAGNITALAAVPTPLNPPVVLPYGMFSFTVTGLSLGQTVTINVTLPGPVPVGTKWWKYQGGGWYALPIGDDDGDNVIMVTLTDSSISGQGDGDGAVNGQILDDGGAGYPAVGWETYPVSKVRVLLPWIALLAAIMAGVSLLVLRRRRAQS